MNDPGAPSLHRLFRARLGCQNPMRQGQKLGLGIQGTAHRCKMPPRPREPASPKVAGRAQRFATSTRIGITIADLQHETGQKRALFLSDTLVAFLRRGREDRGFRSGVSALDLHGPVEKLAWRNGIKGSRINHLVTSLPIRRSKQPGRSWRRLPEPAISLSPVASAIAASVTTPHHWAGRRVNNCLHLSGAESLND